MILMDETGIASFVEIYNEQSTPSIEGKLSNVVQIDVFVCWHAKQSPYCVRERYTYPEENVCHRLDD